RTSTSLPWQFSPMTPSGFPNFTSFYPRCGAHCGFQVPRDALHFRVRTGPMTTNAAVSAEFRNGSSPDIWARRRCWSSCMLRGSRGRTTRRSLWGGYTFEGHSFGWAKPQENKFELRDVYLVDLVPTEENKRAYCYSHRLLYIDKELGYTADQADT